MILKRRRKNQEIKPWSSDQWDRWAKVIGYMNPYGLTAITQWYGSTCVHGTNDQMPMCQRFVHSKVTSEIKKSVDYLNTMNGTLSWHFDLATWSALLWTCQIGIGLCSGWVWFVQDGMDSSTSEQCKKKKNIPPKKQLHIDVETFQPPMMVESPSKHWSKHSSPIISAIMLPLSALSSCCLLQSCAAQFADALVYFINKYSAYVAK